MKIALGWEGPTSNVQAWIARVGQPKQPCYFFFWALQKLFCQPWKGPVDCLWQSWCWRDLGSASSSLSSVNYRDPSCEKSFFLQAKHSPLLCTRRCQSCIVAVSADKSFDERSRGISQYNFIKFFIDARLQNVTNFITKKISFDVNQSKRLRNCPQSGQDCQSCLK